MAKNSELLGVTPSEIRDIVREPWSSEVPLLDSETQISYQPISITLPPVIEGREYEDDESSNQHRMFELRQLFLGSPETQAYAWIPQALEAFRRSLTSDMFPLGTIRKVEIHPKTGTVVLESTDLRGHGLSTGPLELSLEELGKYSLERMLDQIEHHLGEKSIQYSRDMQEAVDRLPPEARYRWDLITRAAQADKEGVAKVSQGDLKVAPVAADQLSGANGVGVFLKNDTRVNTRAGSFSILKVTGEEVPLTIQERSFLEMGHQTYKLNYLEGPLGDFFSRVLDIGYTFESLAKEQGMAAAAGDRLQGLFGKDTADSLSTEFRKLVGEIFDHAGEGLRIFDAVKKEIMQAKGNANAESPFELTHLSVELEERLKKHVIGWAELIKKAQELLSKKKDSLVRLLHKPSIEKMHPADQKRVQKLKTFLGSNFSGNAQLPAEMQKLLPKE